jgi:L-alanine-DL-glutamate epimerase-like enolase superfamily enzyme
MEIHARACELQLRNPWKIANGGSTEIQRTVIAELAQDGVSALGEAAPAALYGESAADVVEALAKLDAARLSFKDVPGSMAYLESIPGLPVAARCLLNLALLDGAAKSARQSLHEFLGLGFREHHHVTSFSIGIDSPPVIHQKVLDAEPFPVLKLKLGDARDRENLAALRAAAPSKPLRLDANEAWKTKEEALRMLEWLASADQHIQYVEQPMPRLASVSDLQWLKARSPLPFFADESCHTVRDIPRCAECFHGVNVKLVKTGGISMALETLTAARRAGLRTMIGCMIETSIQISAAAHLAELADFLDLDGALLIRNDPYHGVTASRGVLSFSTATEPHGLRVKLREPLL